MQGRCPSCHTPTDRHHPRCQKASDYAGDPVLIAEFWPAPVEDLPPLDDPEHYPGPEAGWRPWRTGWRTPQRIAGYLGGDAA